MPFAIAASVNTGFNKTLLSGIPFISSDEFKTNEEYSFPFSRFSILQSKSACFTSLSITTSLLK